MDPEHNFDSDTSESWSVIDINDNEHVNTIELTDGFAANVISETKEWSINDGTTNENNEIERHIQHCENLVQDVSTASTPNSCNIGSSVGHLKGHPDCQILYKGKVFQNDNMERKLSDINCSTSSFSEAEKIETTNKVKDIDNDTDSISVISESECNDLRLSAYETDEICEENMSETNVSEKTNSNILKRKRKRLKLNCRESSEESVCSDFSNPDKKYNSSIQNIDHKKSNNDVQVTGYQSAPVYRHYRNNVANTVLTLAMGVIFTGVACIAIGHFLGVHDAQQTAGDMMETLKRLQMENVLLHSCLTQLSRAFFSRENNKLEFQANVEPEKCLDEYFHQNIHGVDEDNTNHGSPIKNSIFFRGGSFDISTNVKEPSNELSYEKSLECEKTKVLDKNNDEADFMNISKYEKNYSRPPYSSTTPTRVGYVYDNFIPLGYNMEDKKKKISFEGKILDGLDRKCYSKNKDCYEMDDQLENSRNRKDCLAIREKDLSRYRFILQKKKKRKNFGLNKRNCNSENGSAVYIFPQPEEFYKSDVESNNCNHPNEKLKEKSDEFKKNYQKDEDIFADLLRSSEMENRKDDTFEGKKHSSKTKKVKNIEKEKKDMDSYSDDRKSGEEMKKIDNFQKKKWSSLKKIRDYEDNFSKGSRNYKIESTKKIGKMKECRKKGDRECNFKPHSKKSRDFMNSKGKNKDDEIKDEKSKETYLKGEKVRKIKMEKETNHRLKIPRNFRRKKSLNITMNMKFMNRTKIECDHCNNKTAEWFYKWAEGRERCRRVQKTSQWQFDRAKSRAASRIGDAYWQFNRALSRENSRKNAYMYYKKRDMKHKGFYSDAYFWI